MIIKNILLTFLIAILLTCSISLRAEINDYKYINSSPSFSNYGTLGLISNPSARFLPEGTIGFSWSRLQPYLRGSIVTYPFSWMEASYQYTDINNRLYSTTFSFSGNQTLKDKGFDVKIKLFDESNYMPAVAMGLRDMAGTGLFSAEYFVFSKQINNLDISIGAGWGSLSQGSFKNPLGEIKESFNERTYLEGGGSLSTGAFFSGPMGIFGGIELYIPFLNGARFKIELDGVNYDKEGYPPIKKESRINAGFVYPISKNLQTRIGIVRGNTLNIGFSYVGNYGKKTPFIPKSDPHIPIKNASIIKRVNARREDSFLYITALNRLKDRNLYLQTARRNKETLNIAYSQSKHINYVRATGRVAQVLNEITPDDVKTFKISNVNANLGLHTIEIDRDKFNRYQKQGLAKAVISEENFKNYAFIPKDYDYAPEPDLPKLITKFGPSVRTQIGGPDGFFFGDLRISMINEVLIKRNLTLTSVISHGIYDNLDPLKLASNSVLPHVRTDIVEYMKGGTGLTIDNLQFNYFLKPTENLYLRASGGYFESMFAGLGGEALYRPFEKNWAIGIEGWRAAQRDYNQQLGFRDYRTTTGFLNGYYYFPKQEVQLNIKGGKFLAQDSGLHFDFSRRFKNGTRIGAYFSRTDISKSEFGEGSFDKGFYFFIPIESFFSEYSKGYTGFALRPITRDGGAIMYQSYDLWNVTDQGSIYNLTKNIDDLYD
ncbi:YjbH domain-containing protein [Gammaproteobacteria bacterium]|nr:YjbH domain-containing protein [Gammaproteobacteria bacterium]